MARNVEDCGSGTRTCSEKTPGRDYSELSGDLAAVGPSLTRGERALSGRPPHPRTATGGLNYYNANHRNPPFSTRRWPQDIRTFVEGKDFPKEKGDRLLSRSQGELAHGGCRGGLTALRASDGYKADSANSILTLWSSIGCYFPQ
jgi:hypothetical protein